MKQKLHDLALKKIGQIIQSSRSEIDAETVPVIREFFALYMKDNQLIEHIYYAYKRRLPSLDLHHQQEIISYKREESTYSIKFSNKQFELKEFIQRKIDAAKLGLADVKVPSFTRERLFTGISDIPTVRVEMKSLSETDSNLLAFCFAKVTGLVFCFELTLVSVPVFGASIASSSF